MYTNQRLSASTNHYSDVHKLIIELIIRKVYDEFTILNGRARIYVYNQEKCSMYQPV